MALSGIQIYKMLPQTNCKDCGFPTCLAFAMKLAAKQAELSLCEHVSEESAAKLSEASAPPVKPMVLKSNGHEVKAGNEVVMFRHEKTFYSHPGLFVRVYDTMSADEIKAKVEPVDKYVVDYVGIDLTLGGLAVQADGGDFAAAVEAVRAASHKPLILIGGPDDVKAGLAKLGEGETALIAHATADNADAMAALAVEAGAAREAQVPGLQRPRAASDRRGAVPSGIPRGQRAAEQVDPAADEPAPAERVERPDGRGGAWPSTTPDYSPRPSSPVSTWPGPCSRPLASLASLASTESASSARQAPTTAAIMISHPSGARPTTLLHTPMPPCGGR